MAEPSPTLFGMPSERGRWVFVLLGLVINLAIGSIYAWSVFRKPLETFFAVGATESLLPFIVFLALFAFTMPTVGGLLDRYGPRLLSVVGGVIVGAGWLLGSQSDSMAMLTLAYGLIGLTLEAGGPRGLADGIPMDLGDIDANRLVAVGLAALLGLRDDGEVGKRGAAVLAEALDGVLMHCRPDAPAQ